MWSDEIIQHELPRAVKASLASPAVCTLLDCWSAKRNAKVTGRPIWRPSQMCVGCKVASITVPPVLTYLPLHRVCNCMTQYLTRPNPRSIPPGGPFVMMQGDTREPH